MLRGCQRGNQVLIFLFEADLLLGPWAGPLRPASCRLGWQEDTNESAQTPVRVMGRSFEQPSPDVCPPLIYVLRPVAGI